MTSDLFAFETQLNPKARVQLRHIGHEQNPLVVIDDLLLNADGLVDQAAASQWGPPNGTYYPGLNANLPPSYLRTLLPVLKSSFERAFGLPQSQPLIVHGFFALATWTLDRFGPLQRIPHYDNPNPSALAMVHYLCPDQGGGTAFFRHQATGFESIDGLRRQGYMEKIADELEIVGDRLDSHAGAKTPNFDMIDSVEMKFNRAVIYQSHVLHCALFEDVNLTDDPRTGRLTANSFFSPNAT